MRTKNMLALVSAKSAFVLALTVSRPLAAQHADHPMVSQSDSTSVIRTVQALFAAAERADLTAMDSLYAGEELTVIEGAGINRGWKDYRDHHLAPELKEMTDFVYRPFEIEAHVTGGTAWAIFRYALRAKMGEQTIDNVGRGTAILLRKGNKWVVRHTQTTSRARRASDPPAPVK